MSVSVRQLSDEDYRTNLATTSPGSPTEPDDGFGALQTPRGNLPLVSLDIHADVTGMAARIELTQGFRNPYSEPLEATYVFPLPDRAAVTAMRMTAADRTIEGVLKERGEARADYDKAIADGRRASIAEEERPNVFTMRVGNIMPGEQVSVTLSLAGELAYEDGLATLRFPLVVAPRYIPGEPLPGESVGSGTEPDTDAVPDASRITPPVLLPGCPNPIRLSITVDVDPAGLPLSDIAASLHPVKVEERSGRRTHVEIHPGERADRDFILCLRLADERAISTGLSIVPDPSDNDDHAVTDPAAAEGSFALTVLPPTGIAATRPRDVVLVLDRSGSMAGWKMVAARRAAARIVDTLTGRDRFAVLAFDNTIESPPSLPEGLVDATDRNRFRAVEHLTRLEARGGTEMLAPLRRAADLLATTTGRAAESGNSRPGEDAADTERERTVVLVTDGQIGNEDQILRELAERIGAARIHAVGIDRSVNAGFLRRIATLSGGRCELVESEDRLDEAMEAIHRRIGTPLVTDLELHPAGLDVIPETVSPSTLPALYAGAPLVVHGRFRGAPAGGVVVRGRDADGSTRSQRVDALPGSNAALAAVWARAHIRDLEDRYATLRGGRGHETERLEQQIVETSLRFSVLSRFTAYVAVDSEVVNEGRELRRVTQPVDAPQGWDMLAGKPGVAPAPMMAVARSAGTPEAFAAAMGLSARTPAGGEFGRGVRSALGRAVGRQTQPTAARPGAGESSELAETTETPEVAGIRTVLTGWLPRLREARAAGVGTLADLLAELASELDRLLGTLGVTDSMTTLMVVRPLRALHRALRAPLPDGPGRPVELERRRMHALDALEAVTDAAPRTEPGARVSRHDPPRTGTFWKRHG